MKKVITVLSLLLTASTVFGAESLPAASMMSIDGQDAIRTKDGVVTAIEEEVAGRYELEFRNQDSLESIRLETPFLLTFVDVATKIQLQNPSKKLSPSSYTEHLVQYSVALSPRAVNGPKVLESWSGSQNDKVTVHILLKSASRADIAAGVQKYIKYIKESFGFTSK